MPLQSLARGPILVELQASSLPGQSTAACAVIHVSTDMCPRRVWPEDPYWSNSNPMDFVSQGISIPEHFTESQTPHSHPHVSNLVSTAPSGQSLESAASLRAMRLVSAEFSPPINGELVSACAYAAVRVPVLLCLCLSYSSSFQGFRLPICSVQTTGSYCRAVHFRLSFCAATRQNSQLIKLLGAAPLCTRRFEHARTYEPSQERAN